jgi:hypothetical protein
MVRPLISVLVTPALIASMAVFSGCGKAAEKAQEAAIEHALEKDGNADVKVDVKNNAMTIKSTENGETTTYNYSNDGGTMTVAGEKGKMTITTGKSAAIPENFPKDVPQYPGAELQTVMTNTEEGVSSIEATTADALDKVMDWFKDQVAKNGWQPDQTMTMDGDSPMRMMTCKKENRQLMLNITSSGGVTHINCMESKEQ